MSLPIEAAQGALIRSVCERAGVGPDDFAFFEMHGTGTPAGDPIEAAAVGRALGRGRRETLPIGSVKTNIGHLEPASGMAGLIKSALALEQGVMPPSLHCDTPNPKIPFDELNLRLLRDIERIAGGRCAAVNSFGFGGTNGHAVLGMPPRRPQMEAAADTELLPLVISARSATSLRSLAASRRDTLATAPRDTLGSVLRGAARRREHLPERLVALGADRDDIVAALNDFAAGAENTGIVTGTAVRDAKLAFVFAGNGAQWPGMGRDAYTASAAFRDAVGLADAALRPGLGWSVGEMLERGADAEQLVRADIAQPLLFAVQVGIVTVLRGIGVESEACIGHSVGEIAAAWAAGALSLADAARVVVARSRQQERTRGRGRMAAVALGADAARALLSEIGSPLELGAINASQSVTLSGSEDAITRLGAEARRRGVAFRALDLDFAFHSSAMDPIRGDLLADLAGLTSGAPRTSLISTVTGEPAAPGELDAEYWWRNIRKSVRFQEGMARLIGDGCHIFVEIGPHPVLQAYLHDALRVAEAQGRVLGTLTRHQTGADPFPAIAARIHVAGHDIVGAERFGGSVQPDGLPLYPWNKERFWFERTAEASNPIDPPCDHPLLGFRQAGTAPSWLNHLDADILPWLADHSVEGVAVLPGAAVVEMALAAARLRRPDASAIEVVDVELRRPLPFENGRAREVRCTEVGEDGDWELTSRPRLAQDRPTLHAAARLATAGGVIPPPLFGSARPGGARIEGAALYSLAARLGLDYGSRFRTVRRIELLGSGEAEVRLDPSVIDEDLSSYVVHPALLDGALQGLLGLIAESRAPHSEDGTGASFLPWRFGRVRVPAPFGRVPHSARLRVTRLGVRSAAAEIALFDKTGAVVAELSDCWFRRVELTRRTGPDEAALRVDLVPAPLREDMAPAVLSAVADILMPLATASDDDAAAKTETKLLLEALIAATAVEALRGIIDADDPFTIDEIIENGAIASDAVPLFESLLGLLRRLGAAAQADRVWTVYGRNDLPPVPEIWRLLLAEQPELVSELALIAAAAEELPGLLSGGLTPAGAPAPMIEHLLRASPISSAGIDLICTALGQIAACWPPARTLHMLEIGADGGLTRRALDRLAHSGAAFRYVAAATDTEQVARLESVVSETPEAGTACWTPGDEADPLGGRFDVILAAHACARLRLDNHAFAALRDLLAPGGLLIAVDPDPNPLWDLVFGRAPEWWRGRDGSAGGSPLCSGEDWAVELAVAGFDAPRAAVVGGGPWPSSVFWGRAPVDPQPAADGAAPLPIALIVTDRDADPDFRKQLESGRHCVREVDPAAFAAVGTAPKAIPSDAADPGEIAVLVAVDADDPVEEAARVIAMLPPLAAAAAERGTPLWIVTAGAQQAPRNDDAGNGGSSPEGGIVGAAVWGFARVLLNETPRLALRLVDFSASMDWAERGRALVREFAAATPETEIVWTRSGRHVPRLRRGLPPRWAAPRTALALDTGPRSGIDGLRWRPAVERAPGPGEVSIDVHAAGLNFRDVMWGMGLLPEEALIDGFAGPTFGLECAGIVREIGPGVEGLAVGDRVAGFAPAALATRATTAAHAVTRIPDGTSFAAAATIPVTFVTAIYALGTLGRLAEGETVLIHAAAGGVGLAAIQYAKLRGATVIATAGSAVKRAFLRLAGADHVLDSRDLGFADGVRAITGGSGVDVVLNSLSGEAMEASLGLLKPFGRFLELGKRDFYQNRRVHMRPLRQNISYFAIDVDQLPIQRPDLAGALLSEIAGALSNGEIRPLAHRRFAFAGIADAFRLMQASGHIGKLVLTPDDNAAIRLPPPSELALRADGTYLVTGGVSGFGFAAARWLAAHGAGAIALLGRRGGDTPGASDRVAELRALGANACIYAVDVADPASLSAALDDIRQNRPPLRGVIHAASAIADGMAAELDGAAIRDLLRPKLGGAILLDRLTRADPIEMFVLFSSATTLLGAPGQSVYVAANLALEALARRRRAEGLPALAVGWGPIEDAGYLAERPETRDALARRLGAKPMPAAQTLAALPALLASDLPVVAFAETSFSDARRFLPILAAPLFADIRGAETALSRDDSLLERLAGLSQEEAVALLKTAIAGEAASILRLPPAAVDPLRPLSELGMDSLMAVELRLALESRLRVDLPLMSLAEGTSVASIAARLANAVAARPQTGELLSMAERHEAGDDDRLAAVADAAEPCDPPELNSEAAE
ncbi:MAG: SDR family NAD(P)-dependent oxidoreductase [Alphaproteobacteria bacterium]